MVVVVVVVVLPFAIVFVEIGDMVIVFFAVFYLSFLFVGSGRPKKPSGDVSAWKKMQICKEARRRYEIYASARSPEPPIASILFLRFI